jgi:RHS repeat-associated protein
VRRDCKDADGTFAGLIKIPQLSAVVLPDGTSWDMAYYYDNDTSTATCRRGQIERIEYPTGGRIEYDYGRVHMPTPDGCWDPNLWESQVLTVYERTFVDGVATTNPSGTWNYSYSLNEDPDQTGNPPCETWEDWAAELMVLVTQPDGHQIENYFSVWPFIQDSAGPDPTSRFKRSEYGLPFTRNVSPVGGDRYLSSRVLDCSGTSCEVVRSEYVTYAQDGTIGNDLNEVTQHNRRLVNNRTVFEDDLQGGVARFADTARTEFDGVGNFRKVTLTGNFTAGDDRSTVTQFNPELVTWPNASYNLIDWNDPWILGDYDSITSTEGTGSTHKAMQEFLFNATTGFLECVRTRKVDTERSTTGDLIVKYDATSAGMIASESYFGGDGPGQALGTSSICDLASASAQYVINHGYLKGVRISSQYAGVSFKHLDLEVDNWTSLPTSSTDSAGAETLYEYDSMGRLTTIDPQALGALSTDAWTKISYGFSGTARQVTVERCQQNSGTCTLNGLITQNVYEFDGLGRLYREKQRRHDGNLSRRVTLRDEMGRPRRVSSWISDGGPGDEETISATVYGSYDAFGRPLSVTLPDGKSLAYEYLGTRWVGTTRSINTWGTTATPTPGLEENVTSWQAFDRQGRLWRIWEQGFWDPTPAGGHDPCYTHTDYAYDEGSRLISVDQYFWNPDQCDAPGDADMHQQRIFSFDDRGFLESETHPEKGPTGNGSVTYGCFDSRGHARYRTDGASTRRTASRFDAAERLLTVRAPSGSEVCSDTTPTGTVLKEFVYDTATGAGAGKLHTAKRSQAVGDPLNQTVEVVETYTYSGRQGRASTRSTQFKYGGVNGELWTFNTYYNVLGGLGALDYPTCSGGSCGTGTNPPTAARQFQYYLANGWLDQIAELAPTARTWGTLEYHPNLTIHKVTHGASNVVEELGIQSHSMPRPASITVKKGASTLWASGAYAYDGAGNIKSIGTDRFRYDQVSRLIRAELREIAPDQYEDYVFDMFSNLTEITTQIVGSSPVTLNLPVQMVSGTPTNRLAAPHVYDAAGNMINGKGTEASFDLFNMISGYCTSGTLASCSGQEWSYVYTADDERVAAYRVGLTGISKVFTLRDLGNRVLTRDEQRNDFVYTHLVQDYVWRGDRLLGERLYSSGSMQHFGLDHLGTIRLTTNGLGAVTGADTYRPFGVEATTSLDDEPMRFTGHERDLQATSSDPADDVDYMHARYYGPGMARFSSVDPVFGDPAVPAAWNRYLYVGGNPLNFSDPSGMLQWNESEDGLKERAQSVINEGLHGLEIRTGANGLEELVAVQESGQATPEQVAFEKIVRAAVEAGDKLKIGIVSSASDVLIGHPSGKIDIADIEMFQGLSPMSPQSSMAHELAEQTFRQTTGETSLALDRPSHGFGILAQEVTSGTRYLGRYHNLSDGTGIVYTRIQHGATVKGVFLDFRAGNIVKSRIFVP